MKSLKEELERLLELSEEIRLNAPAELGAVSRDLNASLEEVYDKLYGNRWFAIPPVNSGGTWKISNEDGERVAWFETKKDCLTAVEFFNQSKSKTDNYE